jgi:hypothetical protein
VNTALDDWIAALEARHRAPMTTSEYVKAVRALSARYVERRQTLPTTSALDSAGKRAAFAAYYAPLHFLTTRLIVQSIAGGAAAVDRIVDLGCGTGVAGIAWALALPAPPRVDGVDASGWAADEAARKSIGRTAIVLAWAVNELDDRARQTLLPSLARLRDAGARILIIEPIARAASPWWDDWCLALKGSVSVSEEWKFETPLPSALAAMDEAAGFQRTHLSARSLFA